MERRGETLFTCSYPKQKYLALDKKSLTFPILLNTLVISADKLTKNKEVKMQIEINSGGKRHKAAFLSTPHTNAIDWENAHASVVIEESCTTLGLKKSELANLMGVTYPHLTCIQRGQTLMPIPTRSYLAMLCWLKENNIYEM